MMEKESEFPETGTFDSEILLQRYELIPRLFRIRTYPVVPNRPILGYPWQMAGLTHFPQGGDFFLVFD